MDGRPRGGGALGSPTPASTQPMRFTLPLSATNVTEQSMMALAATFLRCSSPSVSISAGNVTLPGQGCVAREPSWAILGVVYGDDGTAYQL